MMFTQGELALQQLQTRARHARDTYTMDRLDRAMDEVVRNFDNPRPASFQVRSAMANAGKVLATRRRLAPCEPTTDSVRDNDVRASEIAVDGGYGMLDLFDWLRNGTGFTPTDLSVLADLADGYDERAIAERDRLPLVQVRQVVTAVRERARKAYLQAVA